MTTNPSYKFITIFYRAGQVDASPLRITGGTK